MNTLIVAPLPPPMSGNSLPVKVLCDELGAGNGLRVVNLNKKQHGSGRFSFGRVAQIAGICGRVWRQQKKYDIVYLTIAESFLGNIRDLLIYSICRMRLQTVVIHMFGGAGMNVLIGKGGGFRFRMNRFYLSRMGGIVVEGKTQAEMFSKVASPEKIHIVHNFAEEHLFVTEADIAANFRGREPLRILFLSNMLYGKGHFELLDAYLGLTEEFKAAITIDFAGKLVTEGDERLFLSKLEGEKNLRYHGPVSGDKKRELYRNAHVFCLPTYYPYEGQPFCILEAYAAGCAVITTNHSGIRDVFTHGVNGFEVEKRSVESLAARLRQVCHEREALQAIAAANLRMATERFSRKRYLDSMKSILNDLLPKGMPPESRPL